MTRATLESIRPSADSVLNLADCQSILDRLQPYIGNYDWIWKIVRERSSRRSGAIPYNTYRRLSIFFNPRKPYFISQTYHGIPFVGHCRDAEALNWMLDKDQNVNMAAFMASRLVAAGGAFLDIGANIGLVSTAVFRAAPSSPIIAVEAVPETAMRAAATFALNGIDGIQLHVYAAGKSSGPIDIHVSPTQSGLSSLHADVDARGGNKRETVRLRTFLRALDSRLGSFPKIGVMKVDVEGHEPDVFAGAEDLIERDRPEIVYEYNPGLSVEPNWTPADINQILSERWGYRCYELENEASPVAVGAPDHFMNCFCTVSPHPPAEQSPSVRATSSTAS